MSERANPFGDMTDFTPALPKPKADPAVIDQVAEAHGFPSRQPIKEASAALAVAASVAELADKEKPTRQKVFRVTPTQERDLRKRCADLDITIQDLVVEGINMVLKSKGLPPI